MLLHSIHLTTALRPSLQPDETLLSVQAAVGLYHGSVKIPEYQNGNVYLTSHRACYIDEDNPRAKAVAVSLKDVERCDIYARFLKSSPKVTLHPKAAKQFGLVQRNPDDQGPATDVSSPHRQDSSPQPQLQSNTTWICAICSFSNPVPSNFDPTTANDSTPLPPCLTCGVKPALKDIVKGALAGASRSNATRSVEASQGGTAAAEHQPAVRESRRRIPCPRCTFSNYPSLTSCEICGAPLPQNASQSKSLTSTPRTGSPAHSIASPSSAGSTTESLKFSFRAGGEKIFFERMKAALVQRKWLLQNAPTPQSVPVLDPSGGAATPTPSRNIGIAGLERRDTEQRKNNKLVIENAFEDLSALMASAKEIIALAEKFSTRSKLLGSSPTSSSDELPDATALLSSLNLTTTREMLGSSASSTSNFTYLTQLARQLADFLTDDTSGTALLRSSGGIISLVDLWAVFNRARGGVELVSPTDFAEAAALFDKLKLPVKLRTMKSGLKVVRSSDWNDERITQAVLKWLRDMREAAIAVELANIDGEDVSPTAQWGRGVTALEAADRFGWSVGVAAEELELVEERGLLCREVGLEGVKFWENWFVQDMVL